MKIVILNGDNYNLGDLSWDIFTSNFSDIKIYGKTNTLEDTIARIKDVDVILAPVMKLTEEILSTDKNLKYVGAMSTGYDMIDINYCHRNGIVVTNIPAYGTEMVSEYAIALLLEICCQVGSYDKAIHKGKWPISRKAIFNEFPIIELLGKTAGIIGFGKIGRNTSKILQALGMKVMYSDVNRSIEEENERCKYSSNNEIFEKADVIFLHCPLFPETRHLINENTINKMKDGVIIINNARGPLIDELALSKALKSGKVYAAGLDVTEVEPLPPNSPLLDSPNCIITPHVSWLARESRERLLSIAYENLMSFIEGKPQNTV